MSDMETSPSSVLTELTAEQEKEITNVAVNVVASVMPHLQILSEDTKKAVVAFEPTERALELLRTAYLEARPILLGRECSTDAEIALYGHSRTMAHWESVYAIDGCHLKISFPTWEKGQPK